MKNNIYLNTIATKMKWKITDGGEYRWSCYEPDSRIMEFGSDQFECSSVFDSISLRVFEITGNGAAFSLTTQCPWRWIDPEYEHAFLTECRIKNFNPTRAWDDINYIDVDKDELFRILDSIIIK
jgi:hypothetical protein